MTTDPEGLSAARAVAAYELGDPLWADLLVGAYLHPKEALERLEEEKRS